MSTAVRGAVEYAFQQHRAGCEDFVGECSQSESEPSERLSCTGDSSSTSRTSIVAKAASDDGDSRLPSQPVRDRPADTQMADVLPACVEAERLPSSTIRVGDTAVDVNEFSNAREGDGNTGKDCLHSVAQPRQSEELISDPTTSDPMSSSASISSGGDHGDGGTAGEAGEGADRDLPREENTLSATRPCQSVPTDQNVLDAREYIRSVPTRLEGRRSATRRRSVRALGTSRVRRNGGII
ncbi:hypothetical protein GN958_ATG13317 [Phytophthora infestans]|nr:hypothetical protein GN958_ATG13317 [Phytophthora infestans]